MSSINNIRKIFESNFGTKGAELQRLTKFDIRTSILDFFEFILDDLNDEYLLQEPTYLGQK